MNKSVILPTALQVCVDDVGWFIGSDDRYLSKPSRTGMTRRHAPEDYIVLNEIGKAIGQKIMCPLVLAEWDKDNILRGEVGIVFDPDKWDRASQIDMNLAKKCFEAAENSEYIEYAFHYMYILLFLNEQLGIIFQDCYISLQILFSYFLYNLCKLLLFLHYLLLLKIYDLHFCLT